MNTRDLSEEQLNLFIDEQLETDEMNEIRKAVLDDKELRERVCQLKAIRELVGYAYSDVPASPYDNSVQNKMSLLYGRSIAASLVLAAGVLLGWSTYEYSPNAVAAISAENTFQYVANHVVADHDQRKIILHIDSSDITVVNAALNEADNLMASYRKARTPMKLDVITNKEGINVLRPDISPYIERIQKLIDDESVSIYACERSIIKAHKKEGVEIHMLPGVTTNKSARELIPERLKKGWVYIKA